MIKKTRKGNFLITVILLLMLSMSSVQALSEAPLSISSKFAISYDIDSGKVIYSVSGSEKSYPASITKLMTALLLAENMEKDNLLTYSKLASIQEAVSYRINIHYIAVGDKIRAEYAMDALLLFSANDMAYVIAEGVAGSSDKFIEMMNSKAKELGMNNTSFETANGLDRDRPNHYTTAQDIALLVKAAYSNAWVRASMGKKTSRIKTENTPFMTITNRNKNLGIDGCVGGKTGYTDKAGKCLATMYERDGRRIVTVVLNSRDIFGDTKKLADYSYKRKPTVITPKGRTIMRIPITYYPENSLDYNPINFKIQAVLEEDLTYFDPDYSPDIIIDLYNKAPYKKLNSSTVLGTITLKTPLGERTINMVPHKDFKKLSIIDNDLSNGVFPDIKIDETFPNKFNFK